METKNKNTDKKFLLTGRLYVKYNGLRFPDLNQEINQEIIASDGKEAIKKSKEVIGEIVKHYPLTIPKSEDGKEFHKIEVSLCVVEKIWEGSMEAADLPTTPSQDRIIKIKRSENKLF